MFFPDTTAGATMGKKGYGSANKKKTWWNNIILFTNQVSPGAGDV